MATFTMSGASETMSLTLVSHVLCPYVQRAAIVLAEKGTVFTRRDVVSRISRTGFLRCRRSARHQS